jgi:hypothetical protein
VAGKAEFVTLANISSSAGYAIWNGSSPESSLKWHRDKARSHKVGQTVPKRNGSRRFFATDFIAAIPGESFYPTRRLQDCSRITGRNSYL